MDSRNNYNKDKRRKTKKKRHKRTSIDLQDKSQESEDICEIPSNYSSHNSEQFTSDYGSTSKYITTDKEEQRLQEKEEKQLTEKEIENLQEIRIIPPTQT